MVDVTAGFGINQRHTGLAIEMTGKIGELVGEDFEERGGDLHPAYVLCAEKEPGKNVTTTADAADSDVDRRLHQVGGVDNVVLQVGELGDIAIVPGDDRGRIRVDVEAVLVYLDRRLAGETPPQRGVLAEGSHPYREVGLP